MTRLRMLLAASSALADLTFAGAARAQTRTFAEDWETDAARWRATDADPINLARDAAGAVCSSRYQRETVLSGGGRVFTRAGIAVTGGGRYCLAAWVRGGAGTQPFLGINLSNAAGAVGTEHWLMGHAPYANNYGGMVTDAPADGAWHWLTAPFTVEATATHVVLKHEIFSAGAAGAADFDDIQLWGGGCPTTTQGTPHATCAGATAVCSAAGVCVQCAASSDCGGATPVCDATRNVCVGCAADADCSGATPACLASGACGECSATSAARCTGDRAACDVAAGRCAQCTAADVRACAATGAGAACVMGACGCASDADCGDARSGRVCDATTSACRPGCRDGGNGCPDGMRCATAMPGVAGTCDVAPPDAGADVPGDVAPDLGVDVEIPADVAVDAGARDAGAQDADDAPAQDVAAADVAAQDAGADDAALDASPAVDAGGTVAYTGDGCGCRAAGRAPTRTGAALLGVALAVATVRRRRRA